MAKKKHNRRGIPILTMKEKLDALVYCVDHAAFEDAAGHLCDLLEVCRLNIITHEGMMFADLQAMVRKYGAEPTEVTDVPKRQD